ncbi:MAG: tripartite tricarboxylate transporter substrate-binding protein [Sulfuricaulis sp.]|nr:tripartite tricarboxylate transporter substrate-binding protein [Sulfuricaulis sp.]
MNQMHCRVAVFAALGLVLPGAQQAAAQTYPSKVVRYLVNDGAGSGGDIVGRVVAAGLSEQFAQQVVVDNRPGAGGRIGAAVASKAPADGYTLLHMSSNLTANESLYKNIPYDLMNDFAPVTQLVQVPFVVVVHPSMPVKSMADLTALARAKPGTINFASAGTGSRSFVDTAIYAGMVKVKMVHVPFKGGGEALTSVLSGETPLMFAPVVTALSHIRAGRVRALAVTTANRLPLLAELPTIAESGVKGYESAHWFGLLLPAKTPKDIVATVNRAVVATLKKPDVIKRINDLGCIPVGSRPEEFGAFLKADVKVLAEVFRANGVTAN